MGDREAAQKALKSRSPPVVARARANRKSMQMVDSASVTISNEELEQRWLFVASYIGSLPLLSLSHRRASLFIQSSSFDDSGVEESPHHSLNLEVGVEPPPLH